MCITAPVPSFAQRGSAAGVESKLVQLYTAGNFTAALVEAEKLLAAVKAQLGTNHPNYGIER